MPKKIRLDVFLMERNFVKNSREALGLILSERVLVDDKIAKKAGEQVLSTAKIKIIDKASFVSRGGEKLSHALNKFNINVEDKVCIDIGSSTGGFTDCLLKKNAKKVYAIDVGSGLLDWNLRNDKRVVLMEKTNFRLLESFSEKFDIAVVDVSFISLKKILPVVDKLAVGHVFVVALIKPQFEAEREEIKKGGIVDSDEVKLRITENIRVFGENLGWNFLNLDKSPILGAKKGNEEFLISFEINK